MDKFHSPRSRYISRRRMYLNYVKEGHSSLESADKVRVSLRAAKIWDGGLEQIPQSFYHSGMEKPGERISKLLTLDERIKISLFFELGYSDRAIARHLKRHHSTVSREIARGLDFDGKYIPGVAQAKSCERMARPKERKIDRNPGLWIFILNKLELLWSPMQISECLKKTNADDSSMQLSPESIYKAIYIQGKGQLRAKLKKLMRQGRTGRKPRKDRGEQERQRFKDPMVNISQRPAEANDRAVPGHWEGDLIMGKGNKSAIGTLVERATRYCILLHLPKDHTADSVQKEVVRKMKNLPGHLRRSLTWDQGSELALHRKISKKLDMQVFFCDPHSPWQRGTNENTNGLLRQYFPKGTSLSRHSDERLDEVATQLNGRPRQTLGWDTPAERLLKLLQNKGE